MLVSMNEQISKNDMIEALLLDYATGALSRPLEVMVETHIALNEESAKKLDMLMKLGGILLEECEPVSLSEDALDNVMAQIEAETNGTIIAMNNNKEAKQASNTIDNSSNSRRSYSRHDDGPDEGEPESTRGAGALQKPGRSGKPAKDPGEDSP